MSRNRDAILGALVADAAAAGLHWIYDTTELAHKAGDEPAFHDPAESGYHQGPFTHYGDHLLVVLESVAECGGFDADDYKRRYLARIGEGYPGYRDHAMKDLLASGEGSDDNQAGCFAKLPVLCAIGADDATIERAVRVTHNNELAVAYSRGAALALREVISGKSVREAVGTVAQRKGAVGKLARDAAMANVDHVKYAALTGQTCPVQNAMPVALHAALLDGDFKDVVRQSILAGGDSSGRLMVSGALRGATDGVPGDWLARLPDSVQELAQKAVS